MDKWHFDDLSDGVNELWKTQQREEEG